MKSTTPLSTPSLIKAPLFTLLLLFCAPLFADTAPSFTLPDHDNAPTSLDQYQGKVVYLDFWASWCGPCRQSFPWMNSMLEKYADQGLEIVAINLDGDHADAAEFLEEHNANFTVLFDAKGVTPTQYAVKGMPTSFLINRQGELVMTHTGFNSSAEHELESAISTLLEQ